MTATIPAVLPAALKYRVLQYSGETNTTTGILDKESKVDLTQWSLHLPKHNGRTLITPSVNLTWNRMHQPSVGVHIVIELKSAFLALQKFTATKTNTHVLVQLYNITAVAYMNQKNHLKKGISVQAEHIEGLKNTQMDFKSRVFWYPCNWMLLRQVISIFY